MPTVKGLRVEISRREILPAPVGRQGQNGRKATRGCGGEAPILSQSAFEIKKRANIIKNLNKPLYDGLFKVLFDMVFQ